MVTRLAAASNPEDEMLLHEPSDHWRIDRKVPLALIAALMVQTLSLVWWAAHLDGRVQVLESHDAGNLLMIERLARVEEKLTSLHEDLLRIERNMEHRK